MTVRNRGTRLGDNAFQAIRNRIASWTRPASNALVLASVQDLARSKPQRIAEHALLRQQLIVLNRANKRPRLMTLDRALLVLLARKVRAGKDAVLIVKPETLLRWHRRGFRLAWKWKSRTTSRAPKLPAATVALIKAMATNNRLWGAERIRGECLKLGRPVANPTIQRYMHHGRPPRPPGQSWATFLRTHTHAI